MPRAMRDKRSNNFRLWFAFPWTGVMIGKRLIVAASCKEDGYRQNQKLFHCVSRKTVSMSRRFGGDMLFKRFTQRKS
jgi:hypothetical protein